MLPGFAAFVAASLASTGGAAGCGCFGEAAADIALGPLHVAVNLALAGAALAVAAGGGLDAPIVERAAVTGAAAVVAWVASLVLVQLPRLLAMRRVGAR